MRDLDGVIEFVGHHREDDNKLESARGEVRLYPLSGALRRGQLTA